MGLHDEHRKRMFEKFAKNGFVGLEEHEKLEIMLYFSVPRRDTNELAHQLLEKFGSLANVMDAPEWELTSFKYITNRTVYLFKMIKEAAAAYDIRKKCDDTYMTTVDEFGTYLQLELATADVERLVALCLDSRGKKKEFAIISEGDIGTVPINTRKLLEVVLRSKATEVVIAHNHPGNIAYPSGEDVEGTEKIKDVLGSVGVILKDHFIVTRDEYCSMAQCEQFSRIFRY